MLRYQIEVFKTRAWIKSNIVYILVQGIQYRMWMHSSRFLSALLPKTPNTEKYKSHFFVDDFTANNFIITSNDLQAKDREIPAKNWCSWPFDLYNFWAGMISMSIFHIFITTQHRNKGVYKNLAHFDYTIILPQIKSKITRLLYFT